MATQKSIAEKLGISVSLVSRVLSGKAKQIGIAEDTIQKVLDEAERSNYAPNSAALSLKGKKTRTLGVISYDFEDPYFGIMLAEMHKIAKEREFTLILAGSYQREQSTMDLSAFSKHSIDGLFIVGSDREKSWLQKFRHKKIPMVQIGFTSHKVGANICVDENASAQMLAELLNKKDLSTAALIFNNSLSHEVVREKYLEVLSAHTSLNIKSADICDNTFDAVAKRIADLKEMPDLIIAGDDVMAMFVIRALHNSGIRVPDDVKVLGFDNISMASMFVPSITSINPPIKDMIEKAFDLVAADHKTPATYRFVPRLIERESTL